MAALISGLIVVTIESIYCIALFIIVSFSFILFQSIVGAFRIFPIPCTCTLLLYCHSYLYHQSSRFHYGINTLLRNSLNLSSKNHAAMCELSTMFYCRCLAISASSPSFSPGIRLCSSGQWKSAALKVKNTRPWCLICLIRSDNSFFHAIQYCRNPRKPFPYLMIRSAICLSPLSIISCMSVTSICASLRFCLTYILPSCNALHLIVEFNAKYLHQVYRANLPSLYHIRCLKYSASMMSLTRCNWRSPCPCG